MDGIQKIQDRNLIHIIIPIFNAKAYLEDCLFSLAAQNFREYRIIVVDDGSSDGSSEILSQRFPGVEVIRGSGDWWWTKSTNAALTAILRSAKEGDYVLTLNIDLRVNPDYLDSLLEVAKAGAPCVVGSPVVDIEAPESVVFCGVEWNPWTAKYKGFRSPRRITIKGLECWQSDILPGRGTLFPVEVFRKAGLYDQKGLPQYAADDDMSLRARRLGFGLLIAPKATVYSHVRATGLNYKASGNASLATFIESLFSLRSPYNLKTRWNFSQNNAKIGLLYFLFDLIRIFGGYIRFSRTRNI